MTDGQALAIRQLRQICEKSDGVLRILGEPTVHREIWIKVKISVLCQNIKERRTGGFPLRSRETFTLYIPQSFPFKAPEIWVTHKRWAEMPHVQWQRSLCLYLSPETEWNIADGMYGFLERLNWFLEAGAKNELDPIGGPIHPPVAYPTVDSALVIPRKNAPIQSERPWLGFTELDHEHEKRVDLIDWIPQEDLGDRKHVGAAILLNDPLHFEFPSNVWELVEELNLRGVSKSSTYDLLGKCAATLDEDESMFITIGVPMRGISGGQKLQHLAVWRLSGFVVEAFKLALLTHSVNPDFQNIGDRVVKILDDWSKESKIDWCKVSEMRPEIVTRRDFDTAANWFEGKEVVLIGCGALGSHISEHLTRAGVKSLILHDKDRVTPGILVRQLFRDADIGKSKAEALADYLKTIRKDVQVTAVDGNVLRSLESSAPLWNSADLIIDATAAQAVAVAFENRSVNAGPFHIPVASLSIGHDASLSMGLFIPGGSTESIFSFTRRAKVELSRLHENFGYLEEFWPSTPRTKLFQPEPGCSSPTFVGSSSDLAILASLQLTAIALWRQGEESEEGRLNFACNPLTAPASIAFSLTVLPDYVVHDPQSGFRILISSQAWSELLAWINQGNRHYDYMVETGGLLFGERNDFLKLMWIDTVSGPPSDSVHSELEFVCGVEGNQSLNLTYEKRTTGTTRYVGLWHTHPNSLPHPSATDVNGMNLIGASTSPSPNWSAMLIVGKHPNKLILGGYVLEKGRAINTRHRFHRKWTVVRNPRASYTTKSVGLALSGGGSRAIAFHLGCLRALHDKGLLDRVSCMSTVSGGSVIGAMYAYSNGSFQDFEEEVEAVLRKGFVGPGLRNLFLSRLAFSVLFSLFFRILSSPLRMLDGLLQRFVFWRRFSRSIQPILYLRRISRTDGLMASMNAEVFKDKLISSDTRDDLAIVINACELKTGTAFRFGNRRIFSWRFGQVLSEVPLAVAVSSSAAYPPFLPALDRSFEFATREGIVERRVQLTDGGVYDNLGLTALLPDRAAEFSLGFEHPDSLMSFDAGAGQFSDSGNFNFGASRIRKAFEIVFRKCQDHIKAKLFDFGRSRALNSVIYSQLGQQDGQLDIVLPQMPSREEVANYPTNFSRMSQSDIDLISSRGEYLTRIHLEKYFR